MTVLHLILVVIGVGAIVLLRRSRWPGWIGVPFIVLTAITVLDVGVSPITGRFLGHPNITSLGFVGPGEVPGAIRLILINTLVIAVGMALAWWIWDRKKPAQNRVARVDYSPATTAMAWKASLALFLFGGFCNLVVLAFLLRGYSIFEIAPSRLVFVAEDVVFNPIYNYARTLSDTLTIGAWGMLLFSGKDKGLLRLALIANAADIFLHVLFGSRLSVVISLIAVMMLYHYGIKPIKLRHVVVFMLAGLFSLVALRGLRAPGEAVQVVLAIIPDILVTESVNEAAFAVRVFPNQLPHVGSGPLIGSLGHFFPTIDVTWGQNLWLWLVENLRGGRNPIAGIGGEHYAPAAEHFMQFGLLGVILFGLGLGLFYGRIFTWQKRQPSNLFLLMLATYAFQGFFASVLDGKMIAWVGGIGFAALLPIGFLAAVTHGRRNFEHTFLMALFVCALSFLLRRLFDAALFDYTFAIALGYMYLMSLKFINNANPAGRKNEQKQPEVTISQGLPDPNASIGL